MSAIERMGFVRQERTYIVELKPGSVFWLNDGNAVMWTTWLACLLVCAAVAFAVRAEYKRESTLYLSAGVIVATIGAGLLSPLGMVVAQFIGIVALAGIRRRSAIGI